jgi:Calcineurin-like phosphoesterase/TAT (twin-arginine translocation) pathway signal sequence
MLDYTRRDFLKATAATAVGSAILGDHSLALAADPYADAVFQPGPPPLPENGAFSVVVLPDTQGYSMSYPESYVAQTKWIVDHKADRNIACVLHLGDITNNNTPDQWQNAVRAMNLLDGQVPYFMTLGNHDYGDNGHCKDRTTLFHEYFPREKYSGLPEFGGSYDREPERFDNSYHFFSAGGREFIVLSLEFGPRNDVVRWANEVVQQHPDRSAILITHAFIYYDDTRYDWAQYGADQLWNPHSYPVAKATDDDVNDGQQLWDKLVSRHDNFVMTLNGHVCADGIGRVVTQLPSGEELPQLLVNYQVKPRGGDGWLRVLEFKADGKTVNAYDYSVTRDECNVTPDTTFSVTIPA